MDVSPEFVGFGRFRLATRSIGRDEPQLAAPAGNPRARRPFPWRLGVLFAAACRRTTSSATSWCESAVRVLPVHSPVVTLAVSNPVSFLLDRSHLLPRAVWNH